MAIFKCKMCGASLKFNEGASTTTCEYCATEQTIPSISDEKLENFFNRANHFRRSNDFDKAISAYENILNEDNTNAEAHWGIVLSKFGIEYVDDTAKNIKVPTCHRMQIESILTDEDYKKALEYAPDLMSKRVYEEQAKQIATIQKQILAISQKEEPFDVFICYKETDETGTRTKDSVLAQDIFYRLQEQGLKVFYSRLTLEKVIGQKYEPYIFAALNSAKVMVVLGTKTEYFSATWVKNEWSRYLKIVQTNREKIIIPCYSEIDAYELPDELMQLQSLDMSRIGFMQDLIHGITKVTAKPKDEPKVVVQAAASTDGYAPTVEPLLKRAFMFLEDGEFNSANEYFEKVLDLNPECAQAYEGKFRIDFKGLSDDEIIDSFKYNDVAVNNNLIKAIRFGSNIGERLTNEKFIAADIEKKYNQMVKSMENYNDSSLDYFDKLDNLSLCIESFTELGDYKESLENIKKCKNLESKVIYQEALKKMNFNTVKGYMEALELFDFIKSYKDVDKLIITCTEKSEEIKMKQLEYKYQAANEKMKSADSYSSLRSVIDLFNSLNDYKDSKQLKEECQKKLLALGKKSKKKKIIIASVVAVIIAIVLLVTQVIIPQVNYNAAVKLMNNGEYDEAISAFTELSDYKDSADLIYEVRYLKAKELYAVGEYEDAITIFRELVDYSDSASYVSDMLKTTISAGESHIIGLKTDGTVIAMGDNSYGQCNVEDWSDIISISAGECHTVGLKSDGTVVAVGNNDDSQCNVEDWTDIVLISAVDNYTIGLKTDGTVVAVSSNDFSKYDVGEWSDIVEISAGYNHIVALKSDGTVVAVGYNNYGQCDVEEWTDIVGIYAGSNYTIGLKSDGTVVAVGYNNYGQCDVEEWTDIVAISIGAFYTVGLKSAGTVVAVGYNYDDQCDVEDWTDIVAISAGKRHTIGLKSDGTVVVTGSNTYGQCDVEEWSDIVVILATDYCSIGLKSDGTVVAVGSNESGKCDVEDWTDIAMPFEY